jgi:predicted dehydrogenase
MKKFSSVVVGLGRIGQGFDYDNLDDSAILTHASGFAYHEGFELIGAVDPDETQRMRFEKKYNCPAYSDLQTLI